MSATMAGAQDYDGRDYDDRDYDGQDYDRQDYGRRDYGRQNYERPNYQRRNDRVKPDEARNEAVAPHGTLSGPPVMAIVSIKDQRISLYDATGAAMRAKVSSGATHYETPVGTYSVLQKNREHYSNVYDDAAMPFMQRITWSGVALHEGQLPGYPASHGCVRLPNSFAEQIFPLTKIGMRVIISRDDIAPVEISHAALLAPAAPGQSVTATKTAFEETAASEDGPRAFEPDLTNWPERQAEMAALKAIAAEKASEAERTKGPVEDLKKDVAEKTRHHAALLKVLRAKEKLKKVADDKTARAERDLAAAKNPARLKPLEAAKAKADAAAATAAERAAKAAAAVGAATSDRERAKAEKARRLADRTRQVAAAAAARADRELTAARSPTRFTKQEDAVARIAAAGKLVAEKHAEAASRVQAAADDLQQSTQQLAAATAVMDTALAAAKEAKRKTLPVSIFISRKTQRLYVRQGHEPVLDVPVTIAEPDRPIGTHIYTAVDYAKGASALRWTAVSLGRRAVRDVAQFSTKSRQPDIAEEPMPTDAVAAAAALDRISMPAEIVARFQQSAWPGASLIVSDEGLHKETNQATDFIVLISGEPQGGIKRRPKPAPVYDVYAGDMPYGTIYMRNGRRYRVEQPKSIFSWW